MRLLAVIFSSYRTQAIDYYFSVFVDFYGSLDGEISEDKFKAELHIQASGAP